MTTRHIILAIQFLTRLPTPQVNDFKPSDLTQSARWFPLVGLLVGAIIGWPLLVFSDPWIAAILALVLWVWVTGALHLDGLADVSDALGAAHSSPQRFLEVLKDSHIGAFGATSLMLQLLVKLVLLHALAISTGGIVLLLIPAWARWGSLVWSRYLPPLQQAGMAERFAWQLGHNAIIIWGLLLAATSLWLAPPLLAVLLLVPLVGLYWQRRLGGMSGDCLGASIEVVESLLLLALAIAA